MCSACPKWLIQLEGGRSSEQVEFLCAVQLAPSAENKYLPAPNHWPSSLFSAKGGKKN